MSGYQLRDMRPDDRRFVIKSWIDSYKSSKSAGILMNQPFEVGGVAYDFEAVMGATIGRLLDVEGVHVLVASNPLVLPPKDVHGFLVYELRPQITSYRPPSYVRERHSSPLPLIHYVFMKKIYRGFGIARALLRAAGIKPDEPFLYSCSTAISEQIKKANKIPRAQWEPSCARYLKETSQVHDQASEAPSVPDRAQPASEQRLRWRHERR